MCCCALVVLENIVLTERERFVSQTLKECVHGRECPISNWLLFCSRNQEPSVLQKIKELWM